VAPGGAILSWRSVGLDVAVREPGLPFFIQWGDGVPFPGAAAVDHPGDIARLKSLSVAANQVNLAAWLGDNDLPIIVIGPSGTPAVTLTRGPDDFTLE